MMLFPAVLLNFPNSEVCLIEEWSIIVLILITISLDAEYWQKMTSVIDNPKEHVWDALIDGFEKYLSVLTERAALIQETDALEQQVHLIVPILCNNGC